MHLIANGGLAEEHAAIGSDVEVIGKPHAGIVDDRKQRPVGFVGQLDDFALRRDFVEPHAANAGQQISFAVEGEAKGLTANMREDLALFMVRGEESHDVAIAAAAVEMAFAIQDHILGAIDQSEAYGLGRTQRVVDRIGRI